MRQIKELYNKFTSLEGSLFRYALSYGVLLAVFPGLSIIVMLHQKSLLDLDTLLNFLYLYIPSDLIEPFIEHLLEENISSIISGLISLCASIWVASQSLYAFLLIGAKEEGKNISGLLLRVRSILIFIILILSFGCAGIIVLILDVNPAAVLFPFCFIIFYLFYRTVLFRKKTRCSSLISAAFTAVSIFFVGLIFYWIIQRLPSYPQIYGPLSSIMILFLAVYSVSSLVYLGYCINQILD